MRHTLPPLFALLFFGSCSSARVDLVSDTSSDTDTSSDSDTDTDTNADTDTASDTGWDPGTCADLAPDPTVTALELTCTADVWTLRWQTAGAVDQANGSLQIDGGLPAGETASWFIGGACCWEGTYPAPCSSRADARVETLASGGATSDCVQIGDPSPVVDPCRVVASSPVDCMP